MNGKYICFCGVDGIGKSTQAGRLAYYLSNKYGFTFLQEAKQDFVVNVWRSWSKTYDEDPETVWSRQEFDIAKSYDSLRDYAEVVLPLMVRGVHVVSPRSPYCRLGLAKSFGVEKCSLIEKISTYYGKPDLVIYLSADIDVSMERIRIRKSDEEDFDVMCNFKNVLDIMAEERKFTIVNANQNIDEVHENVKEVVDTFLLNVNNKVR